MDLFSSTVVGIGGAFLGGFLGAHFGMGDINNFGVTSLGLAIAGALILLAFFKIVKR